TGINYKFTSGRFAKLENASEAVLSSYLLVRLPRYPGSANHKRMPGREPYIETRIDGRLNRRSIVGGTVAFSSIPPGVYRIPIEITHPSPGRSTGVVRLNVNTTIGIGGYLARIIASKPIKHAFAPLSFKERGFNRASGKSF